MNLKDAYSKVKQSIVAFTPKYLPDPGLHLQPKIFPIFGTGFVVRNDGVVLTNNHVVKKFRRVPRPPYVVPNDWCVAADYFFQTDRGVLKIPLEVIGSGEPIEFKHPEPYYGPDIPDLSFVRVKATGLPSVTLFKNEVFEGMEIATAGYPMGTDALTAPGWLHQIGPMLQRGIISAILPFPREDPHAYALNIMVQGGASGSPVFDPATSAVLGMVSSGLYDFLGNDNIVYKVPTNISYAVPANYLRLSMKALNTISPLPDDTLSLDELVKKRIKDLDKTNTSNK